MQTIEYVVTMNRPDRVRPITRRLYGTRPAQVVSARQLAGYLTHVLFADRERGGVGTVYHITEKSHAGLDGFSVQYSDDGSYQRV